MLDRADGITTIDSGGSVRRWQGVISEKLGGVDIISQTGNDSFKAKLSTRPFATGALIRVDELPLLTKRTSSGIAQDGSSDITLVFVAKGGIKCSQFGREAVMRPQDCFAADSSTPFEMCSSGRTQYLAMRMPRAWVSRYLQPEEISARRIDGSSGWGAALSAYLNALYIRFDHETPISPIILGDQALQLLELALSDVFEEGTTHRKGVLAGIRSLMREVYQEEDLTPARLARMANLSKAYLHRLYALAGTTFCAELDTLRIDHAAAHLESRQRRYLGTSKNPSPIGA